MVVYQQSLGDSCHHPEESTSVAPDHVSFNVRNNANSRRKTEALEEREGAEKGRPKIYRRGRGTGGGRQKIYRRGRGGSRSRSKEQSILIRCDILTYKGQYPPQRLKCTY
eukprot:746425-Hanusia_phi.AAC.3